MLFDIVNATIEQLVIHKIGSRTNNTENTYSRDCVNLEEESPIPLLLKQYFLASFREPSLFHLEGTTGLSGNMVYRSACAIFDNPDLFYEHSRILAALLYENSSHPQIKPGEFYLTRFEGVQIFDQTVQCLGIFKSENKETYLKICSGEDSFNVNYEEGINIRKLDKGCLIFNVEREKGFVVSLIDKVSKQNEALFWKENFLGLEPRQDNNFFTKNYLDVCKEFVDDVFSPANEVPRTDQIDMLNRSINYFKENTLFNEDKFENEVLGAPDIVDAFNQFKEFYEKENNVNLTEEFKISPEVVKKENKSFRSVLKLDKNFHVYIHGNHRFVEKGFDASNGMHYYKLYFEYES
jgi:hypothetical protein